MMSGQVTEETEVFWYLNPPNGLVFLGPQKTTKTQSWMLNFFSHPKRRFVWYRSKRRNIFGGQKISLLGLSVSWTQNLGFPDFSLMLGGRWFGKRPFLEWVFTQDLSRKRLFFEVDIPKTWQVLTLLLVVLPFFYGFYKKCVIYTDFAWERFSTFE